MRRLINLISAGRNRTVMIRRELPRTRDAGWVRRPDRIKVRRILLSVSSRSATRTAFVMSWLKPQLLNLADRVGRSQSEVISVPGEPAAADTELPVPLVVTVLIELPSGL